jgi:putative spermidine/putrescine transport system substrate-binding protein
MPAPAADIPTPVTSTSPADANAPGSAAGSTPTAAETVRFTEPVPAQTQGNTKPGGKWRSWPVAAAVLVLLIVVGGLGWYLNSRPAARPTNAFDAMDLAVLANAAKAEGQLTVIALPHDWCGYGRLIDGFKAKYPGIAVNELSPDAGSSDEIKAITAGKGKPGAQAPDVIDVGISFGSLAKTNGLIQPYKVSTWDSIPDAAKDADGFWYGGYYGVIAFLVNADVVSKPPKSWADLRNSPNTVALSGDPRSANEAIQSVYSAGRAMSTPGSAQLAGIAGLNYFAALNKAGRLAPDIANAASVAQGVTPIAVAWDYFALAWRDALGGRPNTVVIVPSDAIVAGVDVLAISAYAPHPNAAKLWMEYLYSDAGQLGRLAGYCHPIRFSDLVRRNAIPATLLAGGIDPAAYAKVVFPTPDDQSAARDTIAKGWDSTVGLNLR